VVSEKQSIPTYVAHIQAAEGGYRAVVTRDADQVYEGKVRPNRKAARLEAAEFVVRCPEEQRQLQWDDPFLNEPEDEPGVGREKPDDVCGRLTRLYVDSYVRERHPKLWGVLSSPGRSGVLADEQVTTALLAPVVAVASDTRASVAEPANYVLLALTDYFTAAQRAVAGMAQDSRYLVRAWAMLDIGRRAPRPFQLEVLGRGLLDRSALVRRQAASQALFHRLGELLPSLAAAVSRERKPAVRKELDTYHRLLRDGYLLTPAGRGYVDVTVDFDGGGIGSETVSRAELNARGVEAIAAALRARYGS
jgi:hypothetical protein